MNIENKGQAMIKILLDLIISHKGFNSSCDLTQHISLYDVRAKGVESTGRRDVFSFLLFFF